SLAQRNKAMSLDPALSDSAIQRASERYQVLRGHLKGLLSGLDAKEFHTFVGLVEARGFNETTRQIRLNPARYGFKKELNALELKALETGLKAFVESRDGL